MTGPAYTGSGAYCYSNSLHMCLTAAGMAAVPGVGLLECMTGMPFGASFLKLESPLFFPSPGGKTDPDRGLARALDTVGWTCREQRFEEADAAVAALRDIGYDGHLSAEALPWPDSESAARRTIDAFRSLTAPAT